MQGILLLTAKLRNCTEIHWVQTNFPTIGRAGHFNVGVLLIDETGVNPVSRVSLTISDYGVIGSRIQIPWLWRPGEYHYHITPLRDPGDLHSYPQA